MKGHALATLTTKIRLDRALIGFVVASVAVFAGLGVNEVTGSQWGMVRTLGQYQSVLVAVLVASLLAQEAERGTLAWGLTQAVGRTQWLLWRIWLPAVAVLLGAGGLGLVLAVVRDATPAVWLEGLPTGALSSLDWQWPVGAALLALGIGTLAGVAARRVVPAVSLAGPIMIAVNVTVDATRGRLLAPAADLATAAWVGLGLEAAVAGLAVATAVCVLRRADA
ncbi:hypothetical protein [Cellulomonas soli]|uniref:Uncharacterized protein n=1 Tax=Cellulomonas soli TaxID=931535 RepID=A0A512PD48_9CELL|nr:hypothetical protein [Cellulomonas soli]NYI58651.1 hypothetical protein [Cellulomonas soli]GEP69076.1 hypothetical protein CSO01_17910 [Cellulomonas soli]